MFCKHNGHNIHVDGFLTCTLCGTILDMRHEFLNGVENYIEPLQMCVYRRSKRFRDMLRKLVYPYPEQKDQPILEFFLKQQYDTIQDLIVALKSSGIKDKRYQSIHVFGKLFVRNYNDVCALSSHEFDTLVRKFKDIEFRFIRRTANIPFFNYNWVLHKLLHNMNITRYDPYLKKIKCKKRNLFYDILFNSLYTEKPVPDALSSQEKVDVTEARLLMSLSQNITSPLLLQVMSPDTDGKIR